MLERYWQTIEFPTMTSAHYCRESTLSCRRLLSNRNQRGKAAKPSSARSGI